MLVLGVDFETTFDKDFNIDSMRITEIGAVLWDVPSSQPVVTFNALLWDEDYPESPKELVDITGITDQMLKERGIPPFHGIKEFNKLMEQATAVVAHNGNAFDRPLYESVSSRYGLEPVHKHWIDTTIDINYPHMVKTRKLTHLAAEHGFVNPFSHRAMFDVLTMLKVMSQYDFNEILDRSKQPTVRCVARVPYADRNLAKDRGYYWDGECKQWFKLLKESEAQLEEQQAPFLVDIQR